MGGRGSSSGRSSGSVGASSSGATASGKASASANASNGLRSSADPDRDFNYRYSVNGNLTTVHFDEFNRAARRLTLRPQIFDEIEADGRKYVYDQYWVQRNGGMVNMDGWANPALLEKGTNKTLRRGVEPIPNREMIVNLKLRKKFSYKFNHRFGNQSLPHSDEFYKK